MAKGIAVKVFSDLDVAAVAAAVMQMKSIWGKAGSEISASLSREAMNLKRLEDEMINSANRAARAQIAAEKDAANAVIAERKRRNAELVAEDKRSIAARRAILMAPVADARKAQSAAEAEQAQKRASQAADEHAAAMERNAAAASAGAVAFNKLGMAATAGMGLVGAASLKAATDYEQGLTRIQSATDMGAASISQLHTGLLQLSSQMGVSMKDLMDAAYQTAKSGGIFRDAGTDINFLRDAVKLAQIDMVPLSDVIGGATTSINDFNVSANRMVDIIARMKTAAGDMKTGNIGDLARSLDNIEPRMVAATTNPSMSQDDRIKQFSGMLTAIQRLSSVPGANADVATQWLNNAVLHITNPTGPQAQFLGGLLAKNNMKPSDLMMGLQDPNKGVLWAFQQIQGAIDANKDAQGNVTVPVRQLNQDLLAKLGPARNNLRSNDEKAIADQLIVDAQSGALGDKDLFKAKRIASMNPDFKDFVKVLNEVYGYSTAFSNKSTPMSVPYSTALNMATGTQMGSTLGQVLYGTPQNAAGTNAEYNRIQSESSKTDLDRSYDLVKSTSAWQIADLKAQLHALGVVIGNELLPSFKQFLTVARDVASFFANNKGVLDGFIHSFETLGALWVGSKIVSGISNMRSAFTGLNSTMRETVSTATVAAEATTRVGEAATRNTTPVKTLATAEQQVATEEKNVATGAAGAASGIQAEGRAAQGAASQMNTFAQSESRAANIMSWIGRNKGALLGGGLGAGLGFALGGPGLGNQLNNAQMQGGLGLAMGGLPEIGLPLAGGSMLNSLEQHLLSGGGTTKDLGPAANMSMDQFKAAMDQLPANTDPQKIAGLAQTLRQAGQNDKANYLAQKFNLPKPADTPGSYWWGGAVIPPDIAAGSAPPPPPDTSMPDFGSLPMPDLGGGGGGKSKTDKTGSLEDQLDDVNQRIADLTGGGPLGPGAGLDAGGGMGTAGMGGVPDFNALYSTTGSLIGTPYGQGGIDCSGLVTAAVNSMLGNPGMADRLTTANASAWLPAHGFVMGEPPGPGYLTIGWYDHGGGQNGHMSMTLPDGTPVEQGGGTAGNQVTAGGSAAGAFASEFDHHAYYPIPMMGGGGYGGGGGSMLGGSRPFLGGGSNRNPMGGAMGGMNPFDKLTGAAGKGPLGALGTLAGMLTTFLAELALGNPLGHMMNGEVSPYAWWYNGGQGGGGGMGAAGPMGDMSNMSSAQIRATESANSLAKALDHLQEVAKKHGPGTPEYDSAMRGVQDAEGRGILRDRGDQEKLDKLLRQKQAIEGKLGKAGIDPSTIKTADPTDWLGIAQGESGGNWHINTGNGYYGGLQFNLPTWHDFGGDQYAPRPDLASPADQIRVAQNVPLDQRPGRWPNTYKTKSGVQSTGYTVPGRNGGINKSIQPMDTGAQKSGFSLSGLMGQAGSMGAMAADLFAPGSGAAVQLAMQEANRAAQAAGEVAADLVGEMPLETFFLSGKDLSGNNVNPSNNLIGKWIGGMLGAHTNTPNSAGGAMGPDMAKLLGGNEDPNNPNKTNPPMKKPDSKDPNSKDGNNNNYGVNIENMNFHNGQNADDVVKAQNQAMMAAPGGAGLLRA